MPRTIRHQLCRLLFEANARGNAREASKDLLTLDEVLRWHINAVALRYGDGVHPKHRLMRYHEYFSSRLKSGERVLDVGCGYGALAESMSKTGAVVCGFDLNPKSIEQARKRYTGQNLTYFVGDITTIDLPGRFETVVLSNVLEHIEKRRELLDRLRMKVSPKRFLIRIPMIDRDWMVYFRRELGLPYCSDPTHFIEYTLESFIQEMKEARLAVSSYEVKWGALYAEVVPVDISTVLAGTNEGHVS